MTDIDIDQVLFTVLNNEPVDAKTISRLLSTRKRPRLFRIIHDIMQRRQVKSRLRILSNKGLISYNNLRSPATYFVTSQGIIHVRNKRIAAMLKPKRWE